MRWSRLAGLVLFAFASRGLPAEPAFVQTDLFTSGDGRYALYRIPGIVVTAKGTLLACCEARRADRGDWGASDILIRRSTNAGKTWSPPAKLPQFEGTVARNPAAVKQSLGKDGEVANHNPVAISDRNGTEHFLFCTNYNRCFYTRSDDDGLAFAKPK